MHAKGPSHAVRFMFGDVVDLEISSFAARDVQSTRRGLRGIV